MDIETSLTACQVDFSVSHWIQVSYFFLHWLLLSPMKILLAGGLLVISFLVISALAMRWLIILGRGRTLKRLWLWGFPLALLLTVSPLVIGEPLLTAFVPSYEGQTADAVVVLGRGQVLQASRVMTTAELLSDNRAPRVFISGRGDAPRMLTMLAQLGIDPDKISGENCSRTTEQNAQYAAEQLMPLGVRSIILVSDPSHLLRSQLVFRSLGFEVIPYPSPLPFGINLRTRRLLVMRESLGLVTYGVLGRYWSRPITTMEATAAQ